MGQNTGKNKVDGSKLRAFRRKKGLSQQALEYETDDMGQKVTKRTIGRIENGADAHLSTIAILAKALDVKPDDLLMDKPGPKRDKETGQELLGEHLCSFDSYIEERTKDFTGRMFVFDAIDKFVENNDCGYFFILGDPGIGKSAVAAKLVKEREYIHHFNIRAEGINRADTFLRNICAQLVIAFQLPYQELPCDVGADGRFLFKLITEVGKKLSSKERLVILIDALDEVDESSVKSGANLLFLPPRLPKGVFFVITARPQSYQLRLECNQGKCDIEHDRDENLDDIERYLKKKVKLTGIQAYITKQKLTNRDFVSTMKKLSEGNFMYLRYVIPEIEDGAYKDLEFKDIPAGLQNYYEDHWRRMGMMASPRPRWKIRVIYVLTELYKPVSRKLLAECCKLDEVKVQEILDKWDQFLHVSMIENTARYSPYHTSFTDFLHRKKIVQAAGVTIKGINRRIAEWLYGESNGE